MMVYLFMSCCWYVFLPRRELSAESGAVGEGGELYRVDGDAEMKRARCIGGDIFDIRSLSV